MTSAQKPKTLPALPSLQHVHVIGVCGTLMGAFAAFLRRRGLRVTGSDQNVYPPMSDVLKQAGVELLSGYAAENFQKIGSRPDLVVIGNVIRADNPEAVAAWDSGYAVCSLPEAMELIFLEKTRNLVVAGTHGKTTTTSMLAHVLQVAGRDPSYFIGGVPMDLPHSFHVTQVEGGHPFVLEGDEYDTAYWDKVPKCFHYRPDDVILTSIEFDHADIYADLAAVERAFAGLVERIRTGGRLIACVDYPSVDRLLSQARVPVITYGMSVRAEYRPEKIRMESERLCFEIHRRTSSGSQKIDDIELNIPGRHNVLNALAVWIEAKEFGISLPVIRDALKKFRGVKRRQEVRGEVRGVMVMDDFAHHPTAVKETLSALRLKYPGRRLVAVFEPRSATSRRKIFQQDYALAFDTADVTYISEPYDQSRIPSDQQFSSQELVADLSTRGRTGKLLEQGDAGVIQVAKDSKNGDLVAVLSNGGFGGFIPKLLEALKES